jgi:predicted secreted protein
MNWFTGSAVFLILWFLVLFMVLPWGVRVPDEPEPGHATSAPANPRLGLKVVITTAIAGVLWFVVDWIIANDIISFRSPPGS